ncbi:hypothetical protein Y1Q_0010607 [Alligator mississippiensis]|uniref:Ig-like domain-containing protein n=1 Tax=Alligator mississippiensis TaxID=8496 RepID=A0A151PGT8_ALLMI|nr:hypothetical protein Y1Q_0010607 [Alligator mississippiensis]
MACAYSSAFQTFQWYRQAPSGEITHLLSVPANRNVTAGLFTGESLEGGKKTTLHLVELRLADSGRYLCATDAQRHGQSPAPLKNPPSPDNPGGRDTGIAWQGQ